MTPKEKKVAFNEVKVLASISHPNVLKYLDAFTEDGVLHIVTEFADGGDLNEQIQLHRARREHFSEQQIWMVLAQILSGLRELHSRGVVHRDLKAANIFLFRNGAVKIGDLGVARVLRGAGDLAHTAIGSPFYMSPEIWRAQPYGPRSDMWGLGCLLYEMIALDRPFGGRTLEELSAAVCTRPFRTVPRGAAAGDLMAVAAALLRKDPTARPSAQELLTAAPIQAQLGTRSILSRAPRNPARASTPRMPRLPAIRHACASPRAQPLRPPATPTPVRQKLRARRRSPRIRYRQPAPVPRARVVLEPLSERDGAPEPECDTPFTASPHERVLLAGAEYTASPASPVLHQPTIFIQ
eukprot:gnl/Chilomastix_cuspidata/7989.p1 GENE.gnl/Chilomastix_cuspidata/7989~~gnl/Chilomastix_cuspidata/7989.p1  ORF type:complete len:400 (-),score=112.83 gnl/Chilomastix_cuspidata/7989:46-1104(-)